MPSVAITDSVFLSMRTVKCLPRFDRGLARHYGTAFGVILTFRPSDPYAINGLIVSLIRMNDEVVPANKELHLILSYSD